MSSGKAHPFCGFASALRGEEGGDTLSVMSSLGSNQILRCLPTGSLYLTTPPTPPPPHPVEGI